MDLDRWTAPALSPDGSTLVFAATGADRKRQLWVRRMDGFAVQPLAGTDDAMSPFWSPDSRSIGFFAARKLKRVPAGGRGRPDDLRRAGRPRRLVERRRPHRLRARAVRRPLEGSGHGWRTGGRDEGGQCQGRTHRLPWFLPDGKRLLYVSGTQTSDDEGGTTIQALDLATGKSTLVARENSEGRFVEPGYLVVRPRGQSSRPAVRSQGPEDDGPRRFRSRRECAFEAFRWIGNFTISRHGKARLPEQRGVPEEPPDVVRPRRQSRSAASARPRTSSRSPCRRTPAA